MPTLPRVTFERPPLYPKQQAAIFAPERYSLIEATTKAGKTVGCLIWLLELAMRHGQPGREFWWVAPIFPQAKIAYRRLKRYLPKWMRVPNETELTLTLGNGAVIRFLGSDKPDSLYGEDVWAAVIDEASRCKEEAWHAIRSTLTATRGPVRIIGNVKGRKNWFYRLARKAEQGTGDMSYHRITADDAVDAGVLDRAEIDDAKSLLPEAVFNELYRAIPSDDQGNPFGAEHIRRQTRGVLINTQPVAFGWDLAKSIDWTAGVGLDADMNTCVMERWQGEPWEETIERIGQTTIDTPALVDATGVGDPIVERLQKATPLGRRMKVTGFKFTSQSKQQLMEGLAAAIQHSEVTFPEVVARELEQFEYVYTRTGVQYSAPAGYHDDCVCALALAVQHHRGVVRRSGGLAEVW